MSGVTGNCIPSLDKLAPAALPVHLDTEAVEFGFVFVGFFFLSHK